MPVGVPETGVPGPGVPETGPGEPDAPEPGPPTRAHEGRAWRDQRSEAASVHADALARRRSDEADRARGLIAEFVQEAERRRVAPVRLRARGHDGRRRYRTSTLGWYLRRNESVAVGTDGQFYLLSVPAGLGALLTGVTLEPSEPPLVLGRGGRDGESIDLADALALALALAPPT